VSVFFRARKKSSRLALVHGRACLDPIARHDHECHGVAIRPAPPARKATAAAASDPFDGCVRAGGAARGARHAAVGSRAGAPTRLATTRGDNRVRPPWRPMPWWVGYVLVDLDLARQLTTPGSPVRSVTNPGAHYVLVLKNL
jgi:hypothetical protein